MTDQVKKPKAKKVKVPKVNYEPVPCEEKVVVEPFVQTNEVKPKKRGPRAKKEPTREEHIKHYTEELAEVNKLINNLKSDRDKITCWDSTPSLKALVEDELLNLDDDREENEEILKELMSEPYSA